MIKKIVVSGILIITLAGCLAGLYLVNLYKKLQAPLPIQAPLIYEVKPGDFLNKIIYDLYQKGWVESVRFTSLIASSQNLHNIKKGEFEITPDMSVLDLLTKLNTNDVITYRVTFVEGKTFKDFRTLLNSNDKVIQTVAELSDQQIMEKLGAPGTHPEGQFYPDTYVFSADTSDFTLLKTAYDKMQKVLQQEWENRSDKAVVKSPYEALILASIVEKETGVAYERPEIAGVFSRRITKGYRLQSDPTVIYGMGDRYEGNIRRKDLQEKTPYNTYRINGLPPTPIASPGTDAINAVLNPAETKALYFVAKGDGSHHFSNTLKEHNEAVRKYQIFGRSKNYQSAPSDE